MIHIPDLDDLQRRITKQLDAWAAIEETARQATTALQHGKVRDADARRAVLVAWLKVLDDHALT